MIGVDEVGGAATEEVLDLDAVIAQKKESEAAAEKTQTQSQPEGSTSGGKGEGEKKEPEKKEGEKPLKKVAESVAKTEEEKPADTAAGKPADEKAGEKSADQKADTVKKDQGSDEFANPDEVVFDVNGKDVSATEIFHQYQDAIEQLEAYKGIEKDEWLKKFVDYRLKGGDPLAYLRTQTRDWTQVKEIDLLREAFNESPTADGLDDEAKEELFARELSEKYGSSIDGSFEDETTKAAKLGKQLMKRDAEKVRTGKLEQQKSFALPKSEEKNPVQPIFDPEKERESLLKYEEVKKFMDSKLVRIGDTDYGHEVEDVEAVIGMMADTRNFWRLFALEGGKTDWDRLQKTMAFAANPSAYDATVLALGKNLGEEKYLKEKKNIKTPREENQEKGADTGGFNKLEFLKELKRQNP